MQTHGLDQLNYVYLSSVLHPDINVVHLVTLAVQTMSILGNVLGKSVGNCL